MRSPLPLFLARVLLLRAWSEALLRLCSHGVCAICSRSCPLHRYEGQWLDDRRHGQGTFHHADGSRYEGEWAAGRKEGKGTLYFNNGDSFAGYWSEGVIQGPGVLTLREDSPWNLQDL